MRVFAVCRRISVFPAVWCISCASDCFFLLSIPEIMKSLCHIMQKRSQNAPFPAVWSFHGKSRRVAQTPLKSHCEASEGVCCFWHLSAVLSRSADFFFSPVFFMGFRKFRLFDFRKSEFSAFCENYHSPNSTPCRCRSFRVGGGMCRLRKEKSALPCSMLTFADIQGT